MKINLGISIVEFDYDYYKNYLKNSFFEASTCFHNEIINLYEITGNVYSEKEWELFINTLMPTFLDINKYGIDEIIRIKKLCDILCVDNILNNTLHNIDELHTNIVSKYKTIKKEQIIRKIIEMDINKVKQNTNDYHIIVFFDGFNKDQYDDYRSEMCYHIFERCEINGCNELISNSVLLSKDLIFDKVIFYSFKDLEKINKLFDNFIQIHNYINEHTKCNFISSINGMHYEFNFKLVPLNSIIDDIKIFENIIDDTNINEMDELVIKKLANVAVNYSVINLDKDIGFMLERTQICSGINFPLNIKLKILAIKRNIPIQEVIDVLTIIKETNW